MLRESVKMSWQNILHNKLRSFLTVLGIVIGVTAIIALITIVQGVIDDFNEQFDSVGANTIVIQATGTPLKRGLSDKDLGALKALDGISGFSPTISTATDLYRKGIVYENIKIEGKNEVYFKRNPDIVVQGRGINILDVENRNRICLINTGLQKKLFMGESALGKSLIIGGISYEIVGITDTGSKLRSVVSMMEGESDSVILPYKNVMRMEGMNNVMALELYMKSKDNNEAVINSVKHYLDGAFNYKDDSYMVIEMDSLLDMMKDMQNMMQMMLVGIASIALLVGGIGIMNMMLVSVTERTTEIGLRKALGAEPGRIQLQFLTEAIVLSLLGGFIGILLGAAISFAASLAIGISFALSWFSVGLGVAFSGGVGIIFGFAPAKKASELNPIDALRSV